MPSFLMNSLLAQYVYVTTSHICSFVCSEKESLLMANAIYLLSLCNALLFVYRCTMHARFFHTHYLYTSESITWKEALKVLACSALLRFYFKGWKIAHILIYRYNVHYMWNPVLGWMHISQITQDSRTTQRSSFLLPRVHLFLLSSW